MVMERAARSVGQMPLLEPQRNRPVSGALVLMLEVSEPETALESSR